MIDDAQLVQSLLRAGAADQPTLQEGLRLRGNSGNSLYDVLAKLKLVDERVLVAHAASLMNVPSVLLENIQLEPELVDLVPSSMATRNRVIPLKVVDNQGQRELVLGMVDPLDMLAMDEISTHTGIDIRPVLVGPLELETTIKRVYRPRDVDVVDLGDIAIDVLEDANWAEFFDSAESMGHVEDSSVLSLEMRERPITDVFEVVDSDIDDGLPSLDLLEMADLHSPVQAEATSLDSWDVDDAITGQKVEPTKRRNVPSSEIVSAANAVSLFDDDDVDPATARRAKVDGRTAPEEEDDEFDVGEPTMKKSLADLESDALENTGSTRTERGVKAEGGWRNAGESKRPQKKSTIDTDSLDSGLLDETGKTSMGVGVREMSPKPTKDGETDYGALGRKILKTTDEEDAVDRADVENTAEAAQTKQRERAVNPPSEPVTVDKVEDAIERGDTLKGIGEPVVPKTKPAADPHTREIAEVDLARLQAESDDELARKPTTQFPAIGRDRPAVAARATSIVQIPEDVDTRAALQAVLDLLVERNVLSEFELQALLDALRR
ncbi:MAG: hypothetical protein R3E66_07485 [bacterium]